MAEPCVMWRKLWVGEFTVNSIKMQHCFILLKAQDTLNLGLGDRLSLTESAYTTVISRRKVYV